MKLNFTAKISNIFETAKYISTMEVWKTYRYTELCTLIGGGTPKTTIPEYWDGNIPWLSVKDFGGGEKYVYTTEKSITELGLNNSSTKLLEKDDVIISARGTVGEIAMIPFPMAFNQSCFGIRAKRDLIDPHYLYYLTKTKVAELKKASHGSVFDTITRDTFDGISCELPDLNTQKRISTLLSSIDLKIELNTRINHNLEEQAQALYKSWFVDFEPFKGGKFVNSELGMIPEGWRVGILGELNSFKRGKNLLSKDAAYGEIPVVAGGMEPSCYHNIANTHAPVITISASGANAGYMRLYHTDVWASDCSYIDSSSQNVLFTYCFLRANERLLRHAQTGAVQPHVKPSDVNNFKAIIAPQYIIDDFQINISSLFKEIKNRLAENSLLAKEREILLPKLMSGEIDY